MIPGRGRSDVRCEPIIAKRLRRISCFAVCQVILNKVFVHTRSLVSRTDTLLESVATCMIMFIVQYAHQGCARLIVILPLVLVITL